MTTTSTSATSYTIQLRFCRALEVVRTLPDHGSVQPTATEKLNLYGLYKQATKGDCTAARPSSREVVQYAKWKSWDRLQGLNPVEAQTYYINTLTELLVEFLKRYPQDEHAESLARSLRYLQMDDLPTSEESEFNQECSLGYIQPHELDEYLANASSPTTPRTYSFPQHNRLPYTNSPPLTTTTTASTYRDYPATPELYPAHQKYGKYCVQPMDFLNDQPNVPSDTDTIDREVAAATSNLALISPNYHPYVPTEDRHSKKQSTVSERALESLQTEVTALSEQIDIIRRSIGEKEDRRRQLKWTWLWLVKSVAKHTFVNGIIFLLVFLVLWKRKSPIAYAIMGYTGPHLQDIMRYMTQRLVFWKTIV
ncbi:hypothetical protein DFQ28_006259 [Apophysomyces sp. BC1034]|nr:hypothetical protein DFQ30_004403 [Apophysomyces sp. BC1015]KAG0180435.1 hypothetical protein DFQ29_000681 [Apophysomyces sp. BC1021]KAG0187504.1 hypothetical protein DFQ28_006259 [Apophysomyces sp. BC1034]